MEKWEEIFKNTIPKGDYCTVVKNGEESGLNIELECSDHLVKINFGAVSALRMFDEGILLNGVFDEKEVERFKGDKFSNVIYKLEKGEFGKFVKNASDELFDYLDLKHFIIITMNYVIEIISQWEPNIEVTKK